MHTYLLAPSAAECPALLVDLLEASDRLYHRHVTNIQKAVHGQWLHTVQDQASREPSVFPDETAAQIEARVRDRLSMYREELRRWQAGLIAEERTKRTGRDQAIRAYVASLQA
jgi:hypothetical protein